MPILFLWKEWGSEITPTPAASKCLLSTALLERSKQAAESAIVYLEVAGGNIIMLPPIAFAQWCDTRSPCPSGRQGSDVHHFKLAYTDMHLPACCSFSQFEEILLNLFTILSGIPHPERFNVIHKLGHLCLSPSSGRLRTN